MSFKDKWLVLAGCGLSMIFFVITTTGEVWIKHDDISTDKNSTTSNNDDVKQKLVVDYYGIWKFCFKNGKCLEIVDAWKYTKWLKVPNWLQAVRIFACIACGVEAFGFVNAIVTLLRGTKTLKESKYMLLVGPCLMTIAISIFTAFERPSHQNYSWGWTYILGWASVIFALVYGTIVLLITSAMKKRSRDLSAGQPVDTPMLSGDENKKDETIP